MLEGSPSSRSSLYFRCRNKLKLWEIPHEQTLIATEPESAAEIEGVILNSKWSPDGSYFAVNESSRGLSLYKLNKSHECNLRLCELPLELPDYLAHIPSKQLKWIAFSPLGSYMVLMYSSSGHGCVDIEGPNFLILEIKRSGQFVDPTIKFSMKLKNSAYPGPMQWRQDELFRYCLLNNTVKLYSGHDFNSDPLLELTFRNRFTVNLIPPRVGRRGGLDLWLFAPANEDGRGTVGKLKLLMIDMCPTNGRVSHVRVASQLWGDVDSVDFQYSSSKTRCLLMTSTLVDAAGENYGSVGDLWMCDLEDNWKASPVVFHQVDCKLTGKFETPSLEVEQLEAGSILLQKMNKGVVQDAKWSPSNEEFALIEGKSPSEILIKSGITGEILTSLPPGYRNKLVWSPIGDMLAVGGFGNLAGDLSFYSRAMDSEEKLTMQLIAAWRESCTVLCDWSPCGNFFFTASVRPRMNVDNQIKVWSRTGIKLIHVKFEELHDVLWRYEPAEKFPVLSPPQPVENSAKTEPYRPKNSRGNGGRLSNSEEIGLLTKYLQGELQHEDLPPELRKSVHSNKKTNQINNHNTYPAYQTQQRNDNNILKHGNAGPNTNKAVDNGAFYNLHNKNQHRAQEPGWRSSSSTVTFGDTGQQIGGKRVPGGGALDQQKRTEGVTSGGDASLHGGGGSGDNVPDHKLQPTQQHLRIKGNKMLSISGADSESTGNNNVGKGVELASSMKNQRTRNGPRSKVDENDKAILSNSATSTSTSATTWAVRLPTSPGQNSTGLGVDQSSNYSVPLSMQVVPGQAHSTKECEKGANTMGKTVQGSDVLNTRQGSKIDSSENLLVKPSQPQRLNLSAEMPVQKAGDGNLLSLLQSILPSHATVRIGAKTQDSDEFPRNGPAGYDGVTQCQRFADPVESTSGKPHACAPGTEIQEREKERFLQLMTQAGLLPAINSNVKETDAGMRHTEQPSETSKSPEFFQKMQVDGCDQSTTANTSGNNSHTNLEVDGNPLQELLNQLCGRAATPGMDSQKAAMAGVISSSRHTRQPRAWQYKDPDGVIQGPFSERQMKAWWDRGYFTGGLPVRWSENQPFRPLREVFPVVERVFLDE